jgi:hypothetical protein
MLLIMPTLRPESQHSAARPVRLHFGNARRQIARTSLPTNFAQGLLGRASKVRGAVGELDFKKTLIHGAGIGAAADRRFLWFASVFCAHGACNSQPDLGHRADENGSDRFLRQNCLQHILTSNVNQSTHKMMTCTELAQQIEKLQPGASPQDVARLCLLLANTVDDLGTLRDHRALQDAWKRTGLQLQVATDQHAAMTEELEALAASDPQSFNQEQI